MALHKEIIKEAWDLTRVNKKKLFKYWFFPSLFTSLLWLIFITYQFFAFKNSEFFWWDWSSIFSVALQAWEWVKIHWGLTTFIVILAFFCFLFYIFSPPLCEWALIHYMTQAKTWKPLQWWLKAGFNTFFPLFELWALLAPFHFIAFIQEGSFLIRNFWPSSMAFTFPLLWIMLFLWVIINFIFVFANQYIVLEKEDIIWAMKKSTSLVLWNIKESFFLWTFLLIIIVRIFINIFLILLVPIFFIFIINIFSKINLYSVWVSIWIIVWALMIYAVAYLLAGFNIFITGLWTLAFIEFRKKELESEVKIND